MKKEEVNKQIKEVVRPNGKGEINGNNLQETLLLMNNNAANDEDTASKLNLKANQEETDEKLALKADKTSVYTKEEANALLDLKVNIKDYEADKEVSSKEKQELDIKLTQTKQELDSVKNSLSHMGNGVVGEAKGGSIISLPNNAMKSVVPNYKIEGLTIIQGLSNPNFLPNQDLNASINWARRGDLECEYKDNYLIATATKDGGADSRMETYLGGGNEGDKMYGVVIVETNFNTTNSKLNLGDSYNIGEEVNIKANIKTILTGYTEHKKGDRFRVYINYEKEGDSCKHYSAYCLNLTELFGKGNEPSYDWFKANMPIHIDNVKSVQLPMRVKSVGGNLLRINDVKVPKVATLLNGVLTYSSSQNKDSTYIYFTLPKGDYYFNFNTKGATLTNSMYNRDENVYILTNSLATNRAFSLKKKTRCRIECYPSMANVECYFDSFSISRNSKIDYTPYTESNIYLNNNIELKSVGEVKDYIENGKLYKNIDAFQILPNEKNIRIDQIQTENTLNIIFDITGEENYFKYRGETRGRLGGFTSKGESLTEDYEYFYISYSAGPRVVVSMYKNRFSDLNDSEKIRKEAYEIVKDLKGEAILAATKVENLNTSGLIEANPNGTVFFEPITNLTGFYDNGLDVEGLNILEVEEFSHLVNGVYQSLDVSKVKVEGGKLTHPDAQNGIVYLVYRYDNNAVWGENTISYYNSDKTLKSPNGKIWKKVEAATDTGELVVTLEEVNEEIVEP